MVPRLKILFSSSVKTGAFGPNGPAARDDRDRRLLRKLPVNRSFEFIAADASCLPEGRLEGVPCRVLFPGEGLADSPLGDHRVGCRDGKQGKEDNHRQYDPCRDGSFPHGSISSSFSKRIIEGQVWLQHIRFQACSQPVPFACVCFFYAAGILSLSHPAFSVNKSHRPFRKSSRVPFRE